jgi:GNAT superfamily N-acetyltransferase
MPDEEDIPGLGDLFGMGFKIPGLLDTPRFTDVIQQPGVPIAVMPPTRDALARAKAGISAYDSLVASARARGVDLVLSPSHGRLVISKIAVPKDQRGQGAGSAVMQELTEFADRNGMTLALNASTDFGGNKAGLERFYGRHGFESNLGRKRDFEITEAMRRYPRSR